jgi:hypothetical protein
LRQPFFFVCDRVAKSLQRNAAGELIMVSAQELKSIDQPRNTETTKSRGAETTYHCYFCGDDNHALSECPTREEPPKAGDPRCIRVRANSSMIDFHWCEKCKNGNGWWVTHSTQEHKTELVCEAPAPTTSDSIEAMEIDSLAEEQQSVPEAESEELDNLEMQYIVTQMEEKDDADDDANGSLNDSLDDDDDDAVDAEL